MKEIYISIRELVANNPITTPSFTLRYIYTMGIYISILLWFPVYRADICTCNTYLVSTWRSRLHSAIFVKPQ